MDKPLTYGTVCSGVECMSAAALGLPLKPLFFAEIEPYPCAVLRDHFPNVPNFGDMTGIKYDPITKQVSNGITSVDLSEGLDILAGGTPCFAAGTLVLTPSGYRPIETLRVGDTVIGGKTGLPRRVEAVGSKMASVGTLKILGRPELTCTPNHPFYCMDMKRDNKRWSATYSKKIPVGDFQKTRADESVGKYAGRMRWVQATKVHATPKGNGSLTHFDVMNLAGWYLGDGYIRKWPSENKKAIVLALVSKKKIATFISLFRDKLNFFVTTDGKVTISNTQLAKWLLSNFGEHATSKRVPYWVYSDIGKSALLDGYMATDGSTDGHKKKALTVSPALAYGIADLIGPASVSVHRVPPKGTILGREVNLHDQYTIQWTNTVSTNTTKFINGRYASTIRSYNYDGTTRIRVYNLTVATEHAYVTQGIFSFNCQDFSVAGKRAGADGDNNDDGGTTRSSLCYNFIRLLREIRPRYFMYENVPGMLTSNEGRDFAHFLVALAESGYNDVAWRILDAQYVRVDGMERAVPQRRRRVWVVGCFGENHGASSAILLERDRYQGNIAPRRKTREEIAASLACWAGVYDAMVGTHNAANAAYRICSDRSNAMLSGNPLSGFPQTNISPTLDTTIPTPTKAQGGVAICSQVQCGSNGNNVAPTLDTSIDRQVSKHLEAGGGHVIAVNSNGGNVSPSLTVGDLTRQTTQENERRGGYVLTAPHSFNFELYATPPRNMIDALCARRAKDWMGTDSTAQGSQGVQCVRSGSFGQFVPTDVSGTLECLHTGDIGNGTPCLVTDKPAQEQQVFAKVSHPCAKDGEGERWAESNLAGTRNCFDGTRAQEVVVEDTNAKNVANTLLRRYDGSPCPDKGIGNIVAVQPAPHAVCYDGYNQRAHDELCMTLRSAATGTEGNDADPKVCVPTQGVDSYNQTTTGNCAHPIHAIGGTIDAVGGFLHTAKEAQVSAFENHQSDTRIADAQNLAPTMGSSRNANASNNNPLLVAFENHAQDSRVKELANLAPTVGASNANSVGTSGNNPLIVNKENATNLPRIIVRRLTPLECERLQGLPDGWTTVDFRGRITDELVADFQRIHAFWAQLNAGEGKTPKPKTAEWVRQWLERISTNPPDAPRYKACGNGWATNQPRWILFNLLHYLDPNWMDTPPSAVVWNQHSRRNESVLSRAERDTDDMSYERCARN